MPKLSYLLSLTPVETWRLARRRLPILRGGPAWTAKELLYSTKFGRGIRFAELLLRQEAVVRRHTPWEPLDFADRRVIEIGCGPLAGFGPLAIFCGAKSFESAEPEWDADLFHSDAIAERYLRIFHADLTALYGERADFTTFRAALHERLTVHSCAFEAAQFAGTADIILSQSCLEHVFPLDATVAKLASIQGPQTRFLHLVDFGNHYPTVDPFEGLYEQPPSDYIARRGKAINLLRAPDVENLFKRHGIPAQSIASRRIETYTGKAHPWWRERYDETALFTQIALVVGPAA
jgi:hypothetical protein